MMTITDHDIFPNYPIVEQLRCRVHTLFDRNLERKVFLETGNRYTLIIASQELLQKATALETLGSWVDALVISYGKQHKLVRIETREERDQRLREGAPEDPIDSIFEQWHDALKKLAGLDED